MLASFSRSAIWSCEAETSMATGFEGRYAQCFSAVCRLKRMEPWVADCNSPLVRLAEDGLVLISVCSARQELPRTRRLAAKRWPRMRGSLVVPLTLPLNVAEP